LYFLFLSVVKMNGKNNKVVPERDEIENVKLIRRVLIKDDGEEEDMVELNVGSPDSSSNDKIDVEIGGDGDPITNTNGKRENNEDFLHLSNRRNSGGNLPSPRRSYLNSGSGGGGGNMGGSSSQNPGSSRGGSKSNSSNNYHNSPYLRKTSRWSIIRKYLRGETKTFFGLEGGEDLKEEWLSRRKRFASRRYSERNVDSMPPPSPYRVIIIVLIWLTINENYIICI